MIFKINWEIGRENSRSMKVRGFKSNYNRKPTCINTPMKLMDFVI